jgi:hypothetical protein
MVNSLTIYKFLNSISFLDEGNYEPLLNDNKIITNEFLSKLKRSTNTKTVSKNDLKQEKQSKPNLNEEKQGKNVDVLKQSLSLLKFHNKSFKKKV